MNIIFALSLERLIEIIIVYLEPFARRIRIMNFDRTVAIAVGKFKNRFLLFHI